MKKRINKTLGSILSSGLVMSLLLNPVNATAPTPTNAASYNTNYSCATVQQGNTVVLMPTIKDLNKQTVMSQASFSLAQGSPSWVSIEGNGAITCTPDEIVDGMYVVTVLVTYADGSSENTYANILVSSDGSSVVQSSVYDMSYADIEIKAGESKNATPVCTTPNTVAPAGIKYSTASSLSWATVAENGTLSLNPESDVEAGTYPVDILVQYPDGSKELTSAKVTVKSTTSDADLYSPSYGDITVEKDNTESAEVVYEGEKPSNETYSINEIEGVTITEDGTIEVDASKLDVDEYTVTVTVTYEDGTTDQVEVKITVTSAQKEIESIELNKKTLELDKGKSETLKVTINPEDTTDDKTITWKSKNEKIAKVDKNGKVTAVAPGTTSIVAKSSNGKTTTCVVTVNSPITSIRMEKEEVSVVKGKIITLNAIIDPEDTTDDTTITWANEDPTIITLDKNGKLKGLKVGTATVTATTSNGLTATCKVKVTSSSSSSSSSKSKVKTSTQTNSSLYLGIAGVALVACIALFVFNKKKK